MAAPAVQRRSGPDCCRTSAREELRRLRQDAENELQDRLAGHHVHVDLVLGPDGDIGAYQPPEGAQGSGNVAGRGVFERRHAVLRVALPCLVEPERKVRINVPPCLSSMASELHGRAAGSAAACPSTSHHSLERTLAPCLSCTSYASSATARVNSVVPSAWFSTVARTARASATTRRRARLLRNRLCRRPGHRPAADLHPGRRAALRGTPTCRHRLAPQPPPQRPGDATESTCRTSADLNQR